MARQGIPRDAIKAFREIRDRRRIAAMRVLRSVALHVARRDRDDATQREA
jgi:hypothetical protein